MRILSLAALVGGAVLAAPGAVAAPGSCAALGGTVQGGDCHVQASGPAYTMEMTFPLDYPDEQAVFGYLSQTREGFVNVAESPDARHQPLEMDVTAESSRSAQTRSVVLKLFQDVGSAHPSTWYRSFTYDIARGKPVTFDTLFAPDAKRPEPLSEFRHHGRLGDLLLRPGRTPAVLRRRDIGDGAAQRITAAAALSGR
jgi:hypothetical protein